MRNVNDFHKETVAAMRAHVKNIRELRKEYATFEKQAKRTDFYHPKAIQGFRDEMSRIKHDIFNEMAAAKSEGMGMCDAYAKEASAANSLVGGDLTDDVRLLNCGVVLAAGDIEQIMQRNENNNTMLRLCEQYAEQHGIKLGVAVRYAGSDERKYAQDLRGAIDTMFADNKYDIIETSFDRLFGAEPEA